MRALIALIGLSAALICEAQEAPLATGQFETTTGVQLIAPKALFVEGGGVKGLDAALSLTGSSFRALNLYSQVTYALDKRLLLSLGGPLVKSATLTGDTVVSQDVTFSRVEQVSGLGDVSLTLTAIPHPTPYSQRGATLSVRAPTGDETARLALGSALGVQAGVFAYQSSEPFFTRASLQLGNGNSLAPELSSALSLGRSFSRLTLEQELRGVVSLGDSLPAETRDILMGAAARRSLLTSVSTVRLSVGGLQPLVSLSWRLAGQNEAKGLSYFIGCRVAPFSKKDQSRSGVP